MQMNFADGMDWTQRGIHFVCVYLVVDELRIAGGMDWTRRGIHSVLCIFMQVAMYHQNATSQTATACSVR